jgi:hypothetical protein
MSEISWYVFSTTCVSSMGYEAEKENESCLRSQSFKHLQQPLRSTFVKSQFDQTSRENAEGYQRPDCAGCSSASAAADSRSDPNTNFWPVSPRIMRVELPGKKISARTLGRPRSVARVIEAIAS